MHLGRRNGELMHIACRVCDAAPRGRNLDGVHCTRTAVASPIRAISAQGVTLDAAQVSRLDLFDCEAKVGVVKCRHYDWVGGASSSVV